MLNTVLLLYVKFGKVLLYNIYWHFFLQILYFKHPPPSHFKKQIYWQTTVSLEL